MFTKEEIISDWTGKPFTKFNYTFNENEPIVGILFGHFAPFTGPNGHGRMIKALQKIGAKSFLIATPRNNKPFDDEREMFDADQRAEIINKYLESENITGEAITYKMQRGGAKSQIGPLVKIAAEKFGMDIRPVFCFGPDREDLASEVCNKFGEIKNPNRCEYIIDYERGTSGTKVRELIKKGDIEGIMKETGYKKETAEMLVDLRNKNLESNKLKESKLNKFSESEDRMRSNGNFKGFWYSSKEKIAIDIEPYEEHLEFLLKRPERLGIDEAELEEIADEWGTTLKRELHDFYDMGERESDFLICGLRKGNLRIRFFDTFDNNDNYLSIEYYDKRNLKKVSDCMIKYESDIKDSGLPIFLYDYKIEKGEDFKSLKDALNFALLNESIEENKENKLEESIRGKVEIDFADIYEADKFKKEMEKRFKNSKTTFISSNFKLPKKYSIWNESVKKSFEKILNEKRVDNFDFDKKSKMSEIWQKMRSTVLEVAEFDFEDDYDGYNIDAIIKNRWRVSLSIAGDFYRMELCDDQEYKHIQKWEGQKTNLKEFEDDFSDLYNLTQELSEKSYNYNAIEYNKKLAIEESIKNSFNKVMNHKEK